MKRCPITYEDCGNRKYSPRGLKLLSPLLKNLNDLPYTSEEQLQESARRAVKMSIQGVQPKLSAILSVKEEIFKLVDTGGIYILKPQNPQYHSLPENEDLTMRLAAAVQILIPFHALIYSRDGSFTYVIRRFDRQGKSGKIPVEDFAQLSNASRDTKYDSSMEKVAEIINNYSSFPAKERIELFKRVLFCYVTGNEDMHLKNFSLITNGLVTSFSPAYDLVNTTLAFPSTEEEMALPLKGKKRNINKNDLFRYFAKERLQITDAALAAMLRDFTTGIRIWPSIIERSFLSPGQKKDYRDIVESRLKKVEIESPWGA